jgi:hypothetical protein
MVSNRRMEKLRNEEPQDLYSTPDIIQVIKPRRMRWAWHVVHAGWGEEYVQGFGG